MSADTAARETADAVVAVPIAAPATAPASGRLWWQVTLLAWVFLGAFLLDRLALLLMDFWLLESLDLESVFWTNFRTGAVLFVVAFLTAGAVIGPAFVNRVSPAVRRTVINVGLLWGFFAGYLLSLEYLEFLMATGQPFGQTDPVFGNDGGFYVFTLPPVWTSWWFLSGGTFLALGSWVLCSWLGYEGSDEPRSDMSRAARFLGVVSTRGTLVTLGVLGILASVGWWLARYDVLTMDNSDSSVFVGASYVDVVGLFSTVNDYVFTACVTLALTVIGILVLSQLAEAVRGRGGDGWRPSVARYSRWMLILLVLDFGFKAAIGVRQTLFVKPNEPVIQLPYISAHVEATRDAFNLGDIETIRLIPKDVGDPLPDVDALMQHPSVRNASLWPGFCSYLEDLIDPQHSKRIFQTGGDTMIYGPMLEILRQQQKLRAYYNFLDVDTIRAEVDGRPTMLTSAVREVPLVEPAPWLAWWGQQFMLFTHGYGIVTAEAGAVTGAGDPVYVSYGIPVESRSPALETPNPRVYYGEGAGSMAYSNVQKMTELDYPTDEGREVLTYPTDEKAGVVLDSIWKRLVLGYKSGQFFEIVFSDLIDAQTRAHYYRTPLQRLERVAPFLFFDSDPFAIPAQGRVQWLVNGMTYTDAYFYSEYQDLGDKSDSRSPFPARDHELVNYVRDAVKATVDGYTGEVTLYPFADEPIVNTLREIYPGMFTEASEMPADVRAQLQYPVQLMHVQFDDLYIVYQMEDTMTFFNMEDMWDDGDEVLGPIMDTGNAIRFSIEPFYAMLKTGDGLLPESDRDVQFSQVMLFTPEKALNLRAIPIVFQDGEDYGRVLCLQVPKGHYFLGPEQADALIDEDPVITEQIALWNRRGVEVIRGHTTVLIVDGEIIYVEPVFLRSQQNPVTQLKQVCVVFRGTAAMAPTLRDALDAAIDAHRSE